MTGSVVRKVESAIHWIVSFNLCKIGQRMAKTSILVNNITFLNL